MLLAEINLVRDVNDEDTWVTDGDECNFACAERFDPLFRVAPETNFLTLLVFDSPEEDCTRIDIEPIFEEDIDDEGNFVSSIRPIDYDLFCGGDRLTDEGTYRGLRRRLHDIEAKVLWCKVD